VSQALSRYQAMYESVRSRSRKQPAPQGLDGYAAQFGLWLTGYRVTVPQLRKLAQRVDLLKPEYNQLGEKALDERVEQARAAYMRRQKGDDLDAAAMATVREVARRLTGEEAYLVQLMGAFALSKGCIAQMLTGEGKTLTGSIAAPLIAWQHKRLHVFTVNDYLASRDAQSRRAIYKRCLLDCGAITQEQESAERTEVYAKPIVYGTAKQITADYLRDQLKLRDASSAWAGRGLTNLAQTTLHGAEMGPMIPGLCAALVDEADAVLVDEGVVPLIIAQPRRGDEMASIYGTAAHLAKRLVQKDDYTVDLLRKKITLTSKGRDRVVNMLKDQPEPIFRALRRGEELIKQALIAKHCYILGQQYAIVEGKVQIVDEYTGRILADRSWEHGLHQAVEAKEGLEITADRETLARMSFQRFFRLYPFLAGMTGTAADATVEIKRVYQRRVLEIPTHRPIRRKDEKARIFVTADAKWNAVVQQVMESSRAGRAVLVGTRSVEASQRLSSMLEARGILHSVLNALADKEEAAIISKAGQRGCVTVATNMAGRGTDIKPQRETLEAGGLEVILTEMHTAERIDRQFRGRSGRQGDVGVSRLMLSLEDELLDLYAKRSRRILFNLAGGSKATRQELSGWMLQAARKLMRIAQKHAQSRSRTSRNEVLKQDDWIDKHLPGF
jgi:preprotein translocase subunit SecA